MINFIHVNDLINEKCYNYLRKKKTIPGDVLWIIIILTRKI